MAGRGRLALPLFVPCRDLEEIVRQLTAFFVFASATSGCLGTRYVYVQAPAPSVGATVVAGAPNYNFDRTRRADLDRSCQGIGAPPFGYRVLGDYSHGAAANIGCRPGLNMFGRPDRDIYCCPMLPAGAVVASAPVYQSAPVYTPPVAMASAQPPFARNRRTDLDQRCLSIGAPPVAWVVTGDYQHAQAAQSGCRTGLNMFNNPDPDVYCCPDFSGVTVAPAVPAAAAFERTRRSDLDGNCRSIGAPPMGWRVEGDGNHQAAAQAGCRPGLNMFRNPDPDVYCCGF